MIITAHREGYMYAALSEFDESYLVAEDYVTKYLTNAGFVVEYLSFDTDTGDDHVFIEMDVKYDIRYLDFDEHWEHIWTEWPSVMASATSQIYGEEFESIMSVFVEGLENDTWVFTTNEYEMTYNQMKESKKELHRELIEELYRPNRIAAWLDQGFQIEDYLP